MSNPFEFKVSLFKRYVWVLFAWPSSDTVIEIVIDICLSYGSHLWGSLLANAYCLICTAPNLRAIIASFDCVCAQTFLSFTPYPLQLSHYMPMFFQMVQNIVLFVSSVWWLNVNKYFTYSVIFTSWNLISLSVPFKKSHITNGKC